MNLSNAKVVVYFSSVMSLVLVNITEMWQIILAFMVIVVETFCYFYVISLIFHVILPSVYTVNTAVILIIWQVLYFYFWLCACL